MEREVRTIKEVAEYYGVTTAAVRYWIKNMHIPYEWERVIGRKPRIVLDMRDVREALELSRDYREKR